MLSDESEGDGLQEVDAVRNQSTSGERFVIKITIASHKANKKQQ